MHAGSEPGPTEIYMMPDVSPATHVAFVPPAGGVDYMGNEVAPEYIFDQGLNYPAANNFGYYGTGFEPPGEWGDHHRFFALDGQDLHYLGVQTLYYTPNYGYAQTPYNPYSPYVPGAVVGVDGPFIGSQQYFSSPYQTPPVSSPAYIPVLVHPPSDFVPSSSADPLLFSTSASIASRSVNVGTKSAPLQASSSAATSSQTVASGNLPSASEPCLHSHRNRTRTKLSEGPQVKLQQNNQPLLQESMMHDSASTTNEGGNSGLMQGRDYLSHGVNIVPGPINVTASSNDDFTNFGSNIHGWASVDAYRPGFYFNGVANNGNGSPNVLVEQNKGPRTNRSKGQWTSAGTDGAELNKASTGIAQGNIMINADQYNRDDFPVDHPDAKFFVIKSYSEDDVHKSIKYNVWSSTPNGNKRLDSAYEDARRISVGKPRKCPVFLFFSVNASGQFCGVAEMIGPVDFKRDMDFWQQDKWSGSFPVKWHIIKDVPNTSFRHIILENNENKPVTNSRDTQEIPYISGMNMLNIFKSSPLRTSILDDFMFYEERQKVMCEEKYRQLGRRFNVSPYVPVFVHANEPAGTAEHLLQAGEKRPVTEQSSKVVNGEPGNAGGQPPTANERQRDGIVNLPNGKQPVIVVDQLFKSDGKQSSVTVDQPSKANGKCLSDTFIQTPKAGRMQPSGAVQLSKTNEKQLNTTVDQLAEMDGKQLSVAVDQSPKADRRKQGCMVHLQRKADGTRSDVDQLSTPDGSMDTKDAKSSGKFGPSSGQITAKLDSSISSHDTANAKPDEAGDSRGVNPVMKIGFLSIDPKEGDSKSSRVVAAEATPTAVVKVGSVQIKVKGFGESSSRLLTAESVPPESKGLKLNKQGSASDNHPPKK